MLVCCVRTGDKYSEDYVWKLRSMVARHVHVPHDFLCITDRHIEGMFCEGTKLPGWWAKIELFRLGEPLIYYDLDLILTNDQQPLLDWDGFGIIRDWNELGFVGHEPGDRIITPMFNSSVMKLTGDEKHVFDQFKPEIMQRFRRGGDQRWITARMPDAKTFPAHWFASYKQGWCEDGPPQDALAVVFHGHPKMPDVEAKWVADLWQ